MVRTRCAVCLVSLAMILGGCKVGPDYWGPPAAPLPPAWQAATPAIQDDYALLAGWWMGFNDPVLNLLIEGSMAQNLDLREAAVRILEARAQRCIVRGDLFPQFTNTDAFTHQKRSFQGGALAGIGRLPGAALRTTYDQWAMSLDGSWEVDVFGRLRRLVEAADADIEVGVWDYRDAVVILLADVATNYVNARTFQERLQIARDNLQIRQNTLDLVQQRYQAELSPELDLAQAQVNVESTASDIPSLEAGYQLALNRLSVLLGAPPGEVDALLAERAPIPVPPSEVAIGIPAELLRRRPDIRRAERELAAQTARIGAAVGELYPQFSILGSFSVDAQQFGQLFLRDSISASIGPRLQWRIFSYGKLWCNVLVQENRQEQRALRYQAAVLRAAEEVDNALVSYVREQERVRILDRAAKSSRRAVELSSGREQIGNVSFQRVLDAQRSLLLAEDQLALSKSGVALDLISLYRALGGGWGLPPSPPVARAGEAPQSIPGADPEVLPVPPPAVASP